MIRLIALWLFHFTGHDLNILSVMGLTRGTCALILWPGVAEQEQFLCLLLACPNE